MPLVADRVMETSTTTGTGTYTLAGAKTGYRAFTSAFSTGAAVYYCATDGTDWEVGVGTFTTSGTTLSRDSIFASSNAGSAVSWAAGTRDVFCTAPMQSVLGTPRIQNKTGVYTVVASDNGSIINCTSGTFTVSLTAAATLGSGFTCWIWNSSTTATDAVTIDPNSTETIDGVTTLILRRGEGCQIVCDGTNWLTGDKKTMRGFVENYPAADARPVASANRSTAIGLHSAAGASQAVTGAGAMALGGSYASGADSLAAAIKNNTSTYGATGTNSVAIGGTAKASGTGSTAIGNSAVASGIYSTAIGSYYSAFNGGPLASGQGAVALGEGPIASGVNSTAIGRDVSATADESVALGRQSLAATKNKFAYAGISIGGVSTEGNTQMGMYVPVAVTTSTAATILSTDNATAGATNQILLPNNSAYAFFGTVVARQQAAGGTASAAWKIEGLIRREANAASTTLVASTVTAIDNTPAWTLALSADTTNGGLAITATGAAATNIRWVATVQTSEVIYA